MEMNIIERILLRYRWKVQLKFNDYMIIHLPLILVADIMQLFKIRLLGRHSIVAIIVDELKVIMMLLSSQD